MGFTGPVSAHRLPDGPNPAHGSLHPGTCVPAQAPWAPPASSLKTLELAASCGPDPQLIQDTYRSGWPRQGDPWSRVTTFVYKIRVSPAFLPCRTIVIPQTRAFERKPWKSPTQLAGQAAGPAGRGMAASLQQGEGTRSGEVHPEGPQKCCAVLVCGVGKRPPFRDSRTLCEHLTPTRLFSPTASSQAA